MRLALRGIAFGLRQDLTLKGKAGPVAAYQVLLLLGRQEKRGAGIAMPPVADPRRPARVIPLGQLTDPG